MNKAGALQSTSREVQAEARRCQLIEAALELFAERGFDATTIKDICERAGVAPGLIYHYFESKESLLLETVRAQGAGTEFCSALVPDHTKPASTELLEIAKTFYKVHRSKWPLMRIFVREAMGNQALSDRWMELIRGSVAEISRYLDTRVRAGELRPHDTEISARILLHTCGMMFLSGEPESRLKGLCDVLYRGIQAERPKRATKRGGGR
ncbi:MAG: TetR/AcrR family transcriptional regulator [Armatimonadetes bacterium]|nr:TetR/AcrR family transcriptional regulator [Armatimonadota bacterium]NOG94035.1 TetR/AcrR family transcriptional regulator [Armatimonadota bacterium]